MSEHGGLEAGSAIAALRARSGTPADPVRWHFIEALARRAATKDGELRQRLEARLAELLQAAGSQLPRAATPAADPGEPVGPAGGPLAALVRLLNPAALATAPGDVPALRPGGSATPALPSAPAELRTLQQHRRTWEQLRIDRQITGAQAQVPDQAGPLHSDRLVLRALQQMRALSPAYLGHFAAHVETLLWLEQTAAPAGPLPRVPGLSGKPVGRSGRKDSERPRKPVRGKPG